MFGHHTGDTVEESKMVEIVNNYEIPAFRSHIYWDATLTSK